MVPKREVWEVAGASTRLLNWSRTRPKTTGTVPVLLLMVPGNPGVIEYYETFLNEVHRRCDGSVEVMGVQHAGHTHPNDSVNVIISPDETTQQHRPTVYSLQDQIDHKIRLLDYLVEERYKDHRIVLVGHSVGAYIACEMMKARPLYPINGVINLFPTLDRIAETPNGRRLWPLFTPLGRSIVSWIAYGLQTALPQKTLITITQYLTSYSRNESVITTRLVDGHTAQNTLYMAHTEMQDIGPLDTEFFAQNHQKMVFYFQPDDGWAPQAWCDQLMKDVPGANIEVCQYGCPHAFVLCERSCDILADRMVHWIQNTFNL